jgi:excisionase family DNA binding protein
MTALTQKKLKAAIEAVQQMNTSLVELITAVVEADEQREEEQRKAAAIPASIPPPFKKGWLSTAEAAEYIGCTRGTIYQMVYQRRIPVHKPAGKLVFKQAELDQFISRNKQSANYELSDQADALLNKRFSK